MNSRRELVTVLPTVLAACIVHAPGASASEYPAKPVSFIVHSSPGSGTDVTARTMANILEQEKIVNQRVVIENKTGGSGAVAISYVAGKTGDPYTIWIVAANVVKYWGAALERMVKTPAWKKYVQDHQMVETFLNDAELAKFLDDMAGPLRQTMTSLGLLKE